MVRFGIIGAGNIARRFAKALANERNAELYAISGRNEQKLESFRSEFPANKAFVGYEQLIECEQIDAVYIALPHQFHKPWAVRALQAGKAVIVEKPASMSAAEMREIAEAAKENSTLFMEAQKERFVTLYREFKRRLSAGDFGEVLAVEASLCNEMPEEYFIAHNTYHYQKGVGGALLDCGTYCASILEDITRGECSQGTAEAVFKHDVDVYTHCRFKIGNTDAVLETAFDRAKPRTATVITERGKIVLSELHRPTRMDVFLNGKLPQAVELDYEYDDFYSEIHHFVELLMAHETESPIMPLKSSIRTAEILDYVKYEANKSALPPASL